MFLRAVLIHGLCEDSDQPISLRDNGFFRKLLDSNYTRTLEAPQDFLEANDPRLEQVEKVMAREIWDVPYEELRRKSSNRSQ